MVCDDSIIVSQHWTDIWCYCGSKLSLYTVLSCQGKENIRSEIVLVVSWADPEIEEARLVIAAHMVYMWLAVCIANSIVWGSRGMLPPKN